MTAEAEPHTGALRVLALALALGALFELTRLSSGSAVLVLGPSSHLFVLGASSGLLAYSRLEASRSVQARPLIASLVLWIASAGVTAIAATITAFTPAGLSWLSLVGIATSLLGLGALTMLTVALTANPRRWILFVTASSMATLFGTFLPALSGLANPTLLALSRAAAFAIPLFALLSSFSIFETSARTDPSARGTDLGRASEPAWRDALAGARLFRAAELTRLLVMLLVFLLGLALLPLGPQALRPLLIGQSLALLFVAWTATMGLGRFVRVPIASGARPAAIAALVLSVHTLLTSLGAAAVDLGLVFGGGQPSFRPDLDLGSRLGTLGTIVAVCLAVAAIARRGKRELLRRRALLTALLYGAATLALTSAELLGATHDVLALVFKLAALGLFTAGFLRLIGALTEVAPLLEDERRRALGDAFE